MTGLAGTLVALAVWIVGIAYLARLITRKPQSVARTGNRGPRLRARPGVGGGMSVRFTPPPRYVPDPEAAADASPEPPSDRFAIALAGLTPAFLCTLCVLELKQARADGQPDPEVLPGVVMGDILTGGRPATGIVCEVRHALAAGVTQPPVLQMAQEADGGLG